MGPGARVARGPAGASRAEALRAGRPETDAAIALARGDADESHQAPHQPIANSWPIDRMVRRALEPGMLAGRDARVGLRVPASSRNQDSAHQSTHGQPRNSPTFAKSDCCFALRGAAMCSSVNKAERSSFCKIALLIGRLASQKTRAEKKS